MLRILLLLLLLTSEAFSQNPRYDVLPLKVELALNEAFPGVSPDSVGWECASCSGKTSDSSRSNTPWVAAGDLDGDGNEDYAVLILLSTRERSWQASLIALLARGNSFEVVSVTKGESSQYIFTTQHPYDIDELEMEYMGLGKEGAIESCIARMEEYIPFEGIGISHEEKHPGYLVWDKKDKFIYATELEDLLCKDLFESP